MVGAALLISVMSNRVPEATVTTEQYEASIQKGLDYLNNNAGKVSGLQWLLLDYLQRKFDLDPVFGAGNRTIQPPATEPEATDFNIHRRIAYPDQLINRLPNSGLTPMRQMMAMATHCDHIPLPKDFKALLEQNIAAGGYDLTHVAYGLERLKENSCAFSLKEDQQLREQVALRMARLVTSPDITLDLRYEAIAFLMHIGRRDLVQRQWLDQIVSEQQATGSWQATAGADEPSDHATLVALWALLEYTRPNAPDEPVLRRPNR